jgi:Uma2 family endonuclease
MATVLDPPRTNEKAVEYRDLGVQEYWIIDRFRRVLTVYFWRSARWSKRTLREGDRYATKLLPGFGLPLADLFRVCDRYKG